MSFGDIAATALDWALKHPEVVGEVIKTGIDLLDSDNDSSDSESDYSSDSDSDSENESEPKSKSEDPKPKGGQKRPPDDLTTIVDFATSVLSSVLDKKKNRK